MTYEEVEQDGRERLLMLARGHDAAATTAPEKAAERHRARAEECRAAAADTTRYLWAISVGGGYGTFHVIGTAAYAEGRRGAKARQEGATAKAIKVREALTVEVDGATTETDAAEVRR